MMIETLTLFGKHLKPLKKKKINGFKCNVQTGTLRARPGDWRPRDPPQAGKAGFGQSGQ